jgi:hypothetical protein
MTHYSLSEKQKRIKIYSYLGLITLLLNGGLIYLAKLIFAELNIYVAAPSFPILFMVIFWLWNSFLWKCKPFSKLHNIKDFSGYWKGIVETEKSIKYKIPPRNSELKIKQNFSEIEVSLRTELTFGKGTVFQYEFGENPVLQYLYISNRNNTVKKDFIENLDENVKSKVRKYGKDHKGVGHMEMINENEIVINYFTNLSENHRGTIRLQKNNHEKSIFSTSRTCR